MAIWNRLGLEKRQKKVTSAEYSRCKKGALTNKYVCRCLTWRNLALKQMAMALSADKETNGTNNYGMRHKESG